MSEAVYLPGEVTEYLITPASIRGSYRLRVSMPIRLRDGRERFPVVYTTDSDYFFGAFTDIANQLQSEGETTRVILVGIGYVDSRAAHMLRWRDFLSHEGRVPFERLLEGLASSPLCKGICDLDDITGTTDAADFLSFVTTEVMPFVESRYPVAGGDNTYAGYSAGGTFGLYTLSVRPSTFSRYILGSPLASLEGSDVGVSLAREFVSSYKGESVQIFISAGELEEFSGAYAFTTGYYELVKTLRPAVKSGLSLSARLFLGETHATAWTLTFSHGLRRFFGIDAAVPQWWRT